MYCEKLTLNTGKELNSMNTAFMVQTGELFAVVLGLSSESHDMTSAHYFSHFQYSFLRKFVSYDYLICQMIGCSTCQKW